MSTHMHTRFQISVLAIDQIDFYLRDDKLIGFYLVVRVHTKM